MPTMNFSDPKPVPLWMLLALCVGFLLMGIGLGWSLKPDVVRVEEKFKDKDKLVIDEKAMEKEVQRRVKEIEATMTKKVVRIVVSKPDGTKVEKETTDTAVNVKAKEVEVKTVEKVVFRDVERVVTRDVERVVTPVLPQWRAGVQVGWQPTFNPLSFDTVTFGPSVERRIVGPIWLGLQATTNSKLNAVQIGLQAHVEF